MTEYFDSFAANYDESLNKGLSLSGENKDFFAGERAIWTRKRISRFETSVKSVLDFGCGIGSSIPFLSKTFPGTQLVGVDPSAASIKSARSLHKGTNVDFFTLEEMPVVLKFDLVFCNGVFHHIPRNKRTMALEWILSRITPEGLFAIWENNPLNPGTRMVMNRIPFDKEAETLTPSACIDMLRKSSFRPIDRSSRFFFPRSLSLFRPFERFLAPSMLGAQYLIISRID